MRAVGESGRDVAPHGDDVGIGGNAHEATIALVLGDTLRLVMRIAVAADERTGIADAVVQELRRRGHEPLPHGALRDGDRADWAWCAEAAARDVADGRAEQAVVCCWTGTGASIAANKVPGVRAALCADAPTAAGARRWNDANVLALSLRATSQAELEEILDAWFATAPSSEPDDVANVGHVGEIRGG
jgi:ribose 5-phosphate isomerase B